MIFDFDGVLADTEALHFETFAAVLAAEGIEVTRVENDSRFLGVSDAGCFSIAFRDAGRELGPALRDDLVARKADHYARLAKSVKLFPGARDLVEEAAARGPVTIASCGRRRDIEDVLERHDLRRLFSRFVSADDIERSKPDPECFLKALEVLRAGGCPDLLPGDCLVFEDSFRGVEAARRAGMQCAAVTHSYPVEKLAGADWILRSLEDWRWL
ncbi:MAG TPA: HAD family phosphatase [Planctomycetota bacterium]|nr:HAD family phosphatase [Planctomycetota bacterium]